MATLYAKTGNWNTLGSWSLTSGGSTSGTIPGPGDDVIFDSNTAAFTINGTTGAPSQCRNLTINGYTGTLTHSNTFLEIYGSVDIQTTGFTYSPTGTFRFKSTSTGQTIRMNGRSCPQAVFDGVGGGWTLSDAWNASTRALTLLNGSLNTNGQTVTCPFVGTGTATRSLTLGATNWITGNTGVSTYIWDISDSTNMTYSGASATITINMSTNDVKFAGGGFTYPTITNTTITSGSVTFSGIASVGDLTLGCGSGGTYQGYILDQNLTVTGTLTMTSNGAGAGRNFICSSVPGTRRTITAAAISIEGSDFQDITGAGAASWNLSAITNGSGDCGNNSGITFTSPITQYWVPSGGTSAGSTNAVTRWATTSGGTAGTGRIPLPQDTLIFDANSIDAGSRTITLATNRMGPLNMSAATNNPAISKSAECLLYGSVTLPATATSSGTGIWTYRGQSSSVLTWHTSSAAYTGQLRVNGTGTLTLGSALTMNNIFTMFVGTFSDGGYSLTSTSLVFNGGTFSPTVTYTMTTGAVTVNSGSLVQTAAYSGISSITINGGSFTTDRAITTSSTLVINNDGALITGGNFTSGASITLNGATCALTSPNYDVSGTFFSGVGGVAQLKSWSGSSSFSITGSDVTVSGNMASTVFTSSAGSLTTSGSTEITFNSASTTSWSGTFNLFGYPKIMPQGAVTASSAGTLQIGEFAHTGSGSITFSNGTHSLHTVSSGGVSVSSGSLAILGSTWNCTTTVSCTGTGVMTTAQPLSLTIVGAGVTFSATATSDITLSLLSTNGALSFSGTGMTIRINGAISGTNMTLSGATVIARGNATLTGQFSCSAGTYDADGYDVSSGASAISFSGTGTVKVRNITGVSTFTQTGCNVYVSGRITYNNGFYQSTSVNYGATSQQEGM